MADFSFHNHGSVVTVIAESDSAKEYAAEHFTVEAWQGTPEHFACEYRYALDIHNCVIEEGFTVE